MEKVSSRRNRVDFKRIENTREKADSEVKISSESQNKCRNESL